MIIPENKELRWNLWTERLKDKKISHSHNTYDRVTDSAKALTAIDIDFDQTNHLENSNNLPSRYKWFLK